MSPNPMAMMGGMGMPPQNPMEEMGEMMPQGQPTADPQISMLIQMLMGGAMQGMSQSATDPNALLQTLMAQQGPGPMAPPMGGQTSQPMM